MNEHEIEILEKYLTSIQIRFDNMYHKGLDLKGKVRFDEMNENFTKRDNKITPGEFEYLFDRTHELGRYPTYNTHKGYHHKYGYMETCPVLLIARYLVDWSSPCSSRFRQILTNYFQFKIPYNKPRPAPIKLDTDLFDFS